VSTETTPEKVAVDSSGAGYGIKYLYDELAPNVDPLSEKNKLVLLTGPLSGTPGVALSRWMAVTKSPLTGAFARSVGGTTSAPGSGSSITRCSSSRVKPINRYTCTSPRRL